MAIERIDGARRDFYRYQKHDTTIMVGGTSTRFQPLIIGGKWSDECWFSFVFPINNTSRNCTFVNGVVQIVLGNYSFKFYEDANGDLEYEIILGRKPAKSTFEIDIDFPAGLNFYYIPPLTQAEIGHGRIQPANAANSYALYWNRQNNQYKTGKLCHIYRPLLTDALGNWTWGTITINPTTKKLTIAADSVWLRDATYPVVIDPTFGYTSLGANGDECNAGFLYGISTAAPSSSGTADSISVGIAYAASGRTLKGVIVDHTNSDTLITNGVGGEVSVPESGWVTSSFGTPPTITSGTEYYPCFTATGGSFYVAYDYTGTDYPTDWYGRADTSNSYTTPESPGTWVLKDVQYSIYATYTEAAPPASLLLKSPRKNMMRSLLAR